MSWGLEWLGLDAGADERAIKRAYAQRLRSTRPDEDPVGFQRLHDAYQDALTGGRGGDVLVEVPARRLPDVPLDAAEALQQLLRHSGDVPNAQYAQWLMTQTREWSLDIRHTAGWLLIDTLRSGSLALNQAKLADLYRFFGFDDVYSGVDPYEWHQHVVRAHQAWRQIPQSSTPVSFERAAEIIMGGDSMQMRARLDALRVPRSRLQNLFAALRPRVGREIGALMAGLDLHPDRPLPDGVNPGQVRFWTRLRAASDVVALQVGLLRVLPLCLLLLGALAWTAANGGLWWAGTAPVPLLDSVMVFLVVTLLPAWFPISDFVGARLRNWQWVDEEVPSTQPLLRAFGIPLLVAGTAVGCAVLMSTDLVFIRTVLTVLMSWKVLRLAQQRLRVRRGESQRAPFMSLLVLVPAALMVWPALVLACVYWGVDLYQHRDRMRWSAHP